MVEEMSTQIMQKDDELIEMRREIREFKRNQEGDRELQEAQDEYIKDLERDISDRDYKIVMFNQTIADFQQQIEDKDKQYNKLKERVTNLNNELNFFKQQDTDTEKSNAIKRIDELLSKQHELVTEYGLTYREYIGTLAQSLKIKSELARYTIMVGSLPAEFHKKLRLDPLGKFIQTYVIRERASLLIKQLIEKYVRRNQNPADTRELLAWIYSVTKSLLQLVFSCTILEKVMIRFEQQEDFTKYEQFAKNPIFNQLFALNSFVEQILSLVREDTLTHRIQQDSFKMVTSKLEETTTALAEEEKLIQIELQKDCVEGLTSFMTLMEAALKKDLAPSSVSSSFKKCFEFYETLIKQYLLGNVSEFGTKNENNITNIKILDKQLKGEIDSLKKGGELTENVLNEQIESILGRLFVYPPIEDDKETEIQKVANRGPWAKVNLQVQHEINQIGSITESLEKTTNELNEQNTNSLILQKEIKDLNSIKDTLEKRVAELQIKSEKVVLLENEKKRAIEKENHLVQSNNRFKAQIENLEKQLKDLEDENKELKEKAPEDMTASVSKGAKLLRSTISAANRTSLGYGAKNIGGSGDDMISTVAANIMIKLNVENYQLRTTQIRNRLNNMNESMPAFKRLLETYRNKQGIDNDDETQARLQDLVSTQNSLNKHRIEYLTQPTVPALDSLSSLSGTQKRESILQFEKSRKDNLEKLKYQANKVSVNFMKLVSKDSNKAQYHAYLNPGLQNILEKKSLPAFGEITLLSNADKKPQDIQIDLSMQHYNRLREIVI